MIGRKKEPKRLAPDDCIKEAVMNDLVIEYDNVGMSATCRCDRCGSQAWVRVVLQSDHALLFCQHHYRDNEEKLRAQAKSIADYRKFLFRQEGEQRDAASTTA